MARHIARLITILSMLAMIVSVVQAQQQGQGQDSNQNPPQSQGGPTQPTQATTPIPAVRSPLASLSSVQDTEESQTVTPDTRALAGAQYLTPGGPAYSHSYWQPLLDVTFQAYSEPLNGGSGTSSGTDWTTYTTIAGQIDVRQISGVSKLDLGYLGGVSIATGAGNGSTSVAQQLLLSETLSLHRWTLYLIDQFGYLPQAAFGYSGLGTGILPTTGITQGGLQTGFVPGQSILTAAGQRLSNVGLVEADVLLTPRGTLTMIGSGAVLHYLDNNLNDTNSVIAQVGYNYELTKQDTLAVFYTFGAVRYNNINQSINSDSVQLAYARRVTGKFSFQVSGGPQWVRSTLPITNSSGAITNVTTQTTDLLWTAYAGLTYTVRGRTSVTGSYSHGVTGGSGVLAGSINDILTGTLNRQQTRLTGFAFSAGYSRNKGIALLPNTGITFAPSQTYNYLFVGADLTHSFGGALGMTLGYQYQYQTSNAPFCVVAPCGTNFSSSLIFFNLSYHPRLIPF